MIVNGLMPMPDPIEWSILAEVMKIFGGRKLLPPIDEWCDWTRESISDAELLGY